MIKKVFCRQVRVLNGRLSLSVFLMLDGLSLKARSTVFLFHWGASLER